MRSPSMRTSTVAPSEVVAPTRRMPTRGQTVAPSDAGTETRAGARVGRAGEVTVAHPDEVCVAEAMIEGGRRCDFVTACGEARRPAGRRVTLDGDRRPRRIGPDREARRLLLGHEPEATRGDRPRR